MTPKFGYDADGDIPPCSIMWDMKSVESWEDYKNKKHGDKRRTSCSCRHFEGKVPSTHKCTVIKNKKSGCFSWLTSLFFRK